MTGIKDRLNNILAKKQMDFQKAKEISNQKIDEKNREKIRKLQDAKPSAITTMRKGFHAKSHPMDVMKEEWHRRRYERKTK